jgi:murein DD-endopeptidase MepM/ murein hydrolase activator NlpD
MARITKKHFGQYITPATSPVQPEKFTGYHTGVDVEYADVTADVPVYAIADGTVLTARTATGYGGVMAIQHTINGKKYIAVYGHLDPKSLVATGTSVKAGQQIAILGDGYSSETDGERKHLHFGIVKGTTLTIAGYVQTQVELAKWIDPLTLYK